MIDIETYNEKEVNNILIKSLKNKLNNKKIIKYKNKSNNNVVYNINIKQNNFIIKNLGTKRIKKISNSLKISSNSRIWLLNKKNYTINPNNKYYLFFQILILFLNIYSIIVYSYFISFFNDFYKNKYIKVLSIIIDLIFFIEIVLNFFVRIYINNYIIKNIKEIFYNYMIKWLFLDLFLIFPFNLFYNYDESYFLFKLSRILRIIKIFKYKSAFIKILSYIIKPGYDRFIFLIFYLILIIHSNACLWFIIGNIEISNSWIKNFLNKSNLELYLNSIFWSLYTIFLVGYGNIAAHNKFEYIFCIITFFISIILNSIIISTILGYINSKSKIQRKKDLLNLEIKKWKKKENMKIINKVENFLNYNYIDQINFIELNKSLNNKWKNELNLEIKLYKLNKIEYFKNKSKLFLKNITKLLEEQECSNSEYIFKSKEDVKYLYFIYKGTVILNFKDKKNDLNIFEIKEGEVFGDIEFFFNLNKRIFNCFSKTKVSLFKLNLNYYEEIFNNQFPKYGKTLINKAKWKKFNIDLKINYINYNKINNKIKFKTFSKINTLNDLTLKKRIENQNKKNLDNILNNLYKISLKINLTCLNKKSKNKIKPLIKRKKLKKLKKFSKINFYEQLIDFNVNNNLSSKKN